jgi:hypothetical protein
MTLELELRNLRQFNEPDQEWAFAELLVNIPMDVAGRGWAGMARGLEKAGYDAYFKPETGLRVLWIRRRPRKPREATS